MFGTIVYKSVARAPVYKRKLKKMKELLAVLAVFLCGSWAEPQAPYPPSGYRPNGPAFELPQKNTNPQYLPPLDPRRPLTPDVNFNPEEDVSVQGLPGPEQEPIFQGSPINGQQYNGAAITKDIRNLDNSDSFRQYQYQLQQEKYREFERQRQFDATQSRNRGNQLPAPQVPRQFTQNTPSTTESSFTTRNLDDARTETTTELDFNEGETFDESRRDSDKKENSNVEVSKQNLQEYPGELFLSSLAQLQLQPQFVPFQQFGQLKAPLYYQQIQQQESQNQVAGYDGATHFAALPSVLAQRQTALAQPQGVIPQGVNPALLVASPNQINTGFVPPQQFNQYQPVAQPQLQGYQPVVPQVVNQANQFDQQPESQNDESRQEQGFVYQQSYQPQEVIYQPQAQIPNPYQSQDQQNYILPQAQIVNYPNQIPQQYQNGFVPQQFLNQPAPQVFQGQDSLQSDLDMNRGDNGVDVEDKEDDDDQDDGSTAIAVATAFGARTQPRVYTSYGAPNPRVAANPEPVTASVSQDEEATENPAAIAVANAVATNRRKSSKLRSRRVRPMFTLDRSGHLVLAQEQN